MIEFDIEKLRYPIGKFSAPGSVTESDKQGWVRDIEELPFLYRNELHHATEEMLNEVYKPGGWTARQVVHHVADSHMNAYIRFKLALTEENPTIKPYLESKWAELDDSRLAPPEISLAILDAVHKRWVLVLRNMNVSDFDKTFFHPESKKVTSLATALAMYSWHGRHHLEHLRIIKRKI
jgi:hypothetical protein